MGGCHKKQRELNPRSPMKGAKKSLIDDLGLVSSVGGLGLVSSRTVEVSVSSRLGEKSERLGLVSVLD